MGENCMEAVALAELINCLKSQGTVDRFQFRISEAVQAPPSAELPNGL
jgi:hypothetical protein